MNKKSFPTITSLSAKSLSSKTKGSMSARLVRKGTVRKDQRDRTQLEHVPVRESDDSDTIPLKLVCPKCNQIALEQDKFCAWCGESFY